MIYYKGNNFFSAILFLAILLIILLPDTEQVKMTWDLYKVLRDQPIKNAGVIRVFGVISGSERKWEIYRYKRGPLN